MNIKRIINKISKYQYISFDIFDTLLKRNLYNPNAVFKIIENEINKNDNKIKIEFFNKRIEAEKRAMKILKKDSVTIEEIYQFIDIEFDKKILMQLEKKIEFDLLQKNSMIYKIYKYCKESNKIIIAISDMYLSEDFLISVLEKNEIKVDRCYSSQKYGKTKFSGELYKYILKDLNIKPNQIIHIGNSLKSDYFGAKKNNIDAIWIYARINEKFNKNLKIIKFLNDEELFAYKNIITFLNNKSEIICDDYYYKLGYLKFGILIYGFCYWLYHELKKDKIVKVFFLSRDGLIVKKAFDILFPNEEFQSRYLYISRRAVRVPLLYMENDFYNLIYNINTSSYLNLKTFVKRLGISIEDLNVKLPFDEKKEFKKEEFFKNSEIKNFYEDIKNDVITNSKKEYDLIKKYLDINEFTGKIAIVDIGWEGTIQKCLNKILKEKNVDIFGYYFGVNNSFENRRAKGYLFEGDNEEESKNVISGSYGLFETLFLAEHGSVEKYKKINDNVEPIFQKYEFNKDTKELNYIRNIHQGCLDFIKDFKTCNYINNYINNYNIYFSIIKDLLINPTNFDISKLENLPFNDTENTTLVEKKDNFKYLNLKLLKKDFFKSVWKIGFLKKIFKINIPYFKLYKKIRMIYKK